MIIPNAVDPSELDTRADPSLFRSRYGIGDNRKLVLFVGRLIKVKGVHLLPRIARLLGSMGDDLYFAVVGDGSLCEPLRNWVEKMGLKNPVITGRVSQEELSAYKAADMVLIPSQSEWMPVAELEATLFRKPVVVTHLLTITDCSNRACRMVEPGDTYGYAAAISQTQKTPPSDEQLLSAEQHGAENLNWSQLSNSILEVYREVTE